MIFSHRIHRSAQNLLVEKGLPQIARIYTDVGGYGILAIPTQPLTQPTICVDQCNPWENFIPTERRIHSKHAPSVRICEICGRTSSACLFCRRVDPTQPKQFSHRFHSNLLAAISSHRFHRSAQKLLVEKGLPQIARIYTDVGGYGILAIPTQPSCCDFLPQNSQNLLAAISSHRFHRSAQKLLVEKGLPQIARIYTDVGGYGILPYPRNH